MDKFLAKKTGLKDSTATDMSPESDNESSEDINNPKRKFRTTWLQEFPWLNNKDGSAYCTACEKKLCNHNSSVLSNYLCRDKNIPSFFGKFSKMNVRFTLASDDTCSCGNGSGDLRYDNVSHPMVVRPEFTMTNDNVTYSDSNYNSGSESSSSYPRSLDYGSSKPANGWKMFAAVALYAWRKRRKECKEALDSLEKLQMETACSKSQLQVYSTLIRVEQKRNEELTCQLKRTLSNLDKAKSSCDIMAVSLLSLKAEKALLEQELKLKYEEYDAMHSVLSQTKSDLFRSMMETRNLQSQLSNEQRSVQTLENQTKQLINEICDLNAHSHQMEETFKCQFEEKQKELTEMRNRAMVLQQKLDELKENPSKHQMPRKSDARITIEVEQLQVEVSSLQDELSRSVGNRLHLLWNQFVRCQVSMLRSVHTMAFYLLPATPPPSKFKSKPK